MLGLVVNVGDMLTILFIIAELDRNKGRPMYQVEIDILYSQVVKTLRLLSTWSYVSSLD